MSTRRNRVLASLAYARRFDPDGDYVRRWGPGLRALLRPILHEAADVVDSLLAPEYAAPIVETLLSPQSRRRAHARRA